MPETVLGVKFLKTNKAYPTSAMISLFNREECVIDTQTITGDPASSKHMITHYAVSAMIEEWTVVTREAHYDLEDR